MRAPGHCAWRLTPRRGAASGSAQSARASGPDEPVILGEREPRFGGSRLGSRRRASERQAARSKLTERPLSNFVKPVPRLRLWLNGWRM